MARFGSFLARVRITALHCLIALFGKLAAACIKVGAYQQAEQALLRILNLKPRHRITTFQLADLYISLGRPDAAIMVLEDFSAAYPSDGQIHLKLAELQAAADTEKAVAHLEAFRECSPNSSVPSLVHGIVYRRLGDLEKSCECLRASLRERETVTALTLLANNLIDKDGIESQVIEILERATRLEPRAPLAYDLLARCKYYQDRGHPHIAFMREMAGKGGLPPRVRSGFHSILGQVFDSLGLWDEAFAHFTAMNELDRTRFMFNMKNFTETVDSLIATFDRVFFAIRPTSVAELSGESLIFIVGMPRSGTSLIEQILASHPEVHGGGERRDIQAIVTELCREVEEPFPSCVSLLNGELIRRLATAHLTKVSRLRAGRTRFVDKMFGNCFEIGFIATLFPRAKFVHSVRDALDTCVSCFCSDFSEIPYSNSLTTLGKVYRQYERIMAHWHSVLPGRIHDVQHEALVDEPASHIRKLLGYCELSWHENCLSPHKTQRPVFTLSATQVKSPISSRSVGRWKNYRKHLGPLIDALGGSRVGIESSK